MRHIWLTTFTFLGLCGLPPQECQAGLFDWLYEPNVKIDGKTIEEVKKAASELIDKAKREAEDLLKGALAEERKIIMDSLDKADGIINGAIDKTFKKLGKFEKEVFKDLLKLEEHFFRQIDIKLLQVESMGINLLGTIDETLDKRVRQITGELERLLSTTGFGKDLSSLQRRPLQYQASGAYRFELYGSVFGIGSEKPKITFGLGRGEIAALCPPSGLAGSQEFSIATDQLNHQFNDLTPALIPLTIDLDKKKWDKGLYISLAPKLPVTYTMVETLPHGTEHRLKPALWSRMVRSEADEIDDAFRLFLAKKASPLTIRGITGYQQVRRLSLPRTEAEVATLRERFEGNKKELEQAVALSTASRRGDLARLSERYLPFGESEFFVTTGATWRFEFTWFVGETAIVRGAASKHNVTLTEKTTADGKRVLTVDVGDIPKSKN